MARGATLRAAKQRKRQLSRVIEADAHFVRPTHRVRRIRNGSVLNDRPCVGRLRDPQPRGGLSSPPLADGATEAGGTVRLRRPLSAPTTRLRRGPVSGTYAVELDG